MAADYHDWTPEQDRFIIEHVGKLTFPEIGRRLGSFSKHQIRGRYLRLREKWAAATAASAPTAAPLAVPEMTVPGGDQPSVTFVGGRNDQTVSVTRVRSDSQQGALEAALAEAKVDAGEWEVDVWEAKRYEGFFRDSSFPTDPDSKKSGWRRTATVVAMWSVKVKLKRRVPTVQEDMQGWGRAVIEQMKAHAPRVGPASYPRREQGRRLMAEFSLPDLHAGKQAWAPESGSTWGTAEAQAVFLDAIDHLLGEVADKPVAEIVLPIGSDFFHIDTPQGETTAGTRQDHDLRWQQTFLMMKGTVIEAINRCRDVAPVHVYSVPGNHDYNKTFFFGDTLASWFHNTAGVQVHNSPFPRKYHLFGCVLIGMTHGDQEAPGDLPMTMALEVPELWAKAKHREFHTGHLHKIAKKTFSGRKSRVFHGDGVSVVDFPAEVAMQDDTKHAVICRTLPSLSGTDAWHARRAYVKGPRAAQGYLWDHDYGYAGHINYSYWGKPTRAAA